MPSNYFTFNDFLPLIQEEPEYESIKTILLEMEQSKHYLRGIRYLLNKNFESVKAYLSEHALHYMRLAILSNNDSLVECLIENDEGIANYVFGEGKETIDSIARERNPTLANKIILLGTFRDIDTSLQGAKQAGQAAATQAHEEALFFESLPTELPEASKQMLYQFSTQQPEIARTAILEELAKREEDQNPTSSKKASM